MTSASVPGWVGRYLLIAQIGQGAQGTVYRARDPRLGVDVAVKVLDHPSATRPSEFLAEARRLRQFQDPKVVTVHDVSKPTDAVAYFVMELCDRGSLADRLTELARPVTEAEAVRLIEQIAAAGRVLAMPRPPDHPNGLVHLDLKPANFLIRARGASRLAPPDRLLGPDEELVIADLGIARAIEPNSTKQTFAKGTPDWAAPEQLGQSQTVEREGYIPRSSIGVEADIHAATKIVISALTGRSTVAAEMSNSLWSKTGRFEAELRRGIGTDRASRHADFDEWRECLVGSVANDRSRRRWPSAVAAAALLALIGATAWFSGPRESRGDLVGVAAAVAGDEATGSPGSVSLLPADSGNSETASLSPTPEPTSTPSERGDRHRAQLPDVAPEPSSTPTPGVSTPIPTATVAAAPSATPTVVPTPTATPTTAPTATPVPTSTSTPVPTPVPLPPPTNTPTPTPVPQLQADAPPYVCIGTHINSPVVGRVSGFDGDEQVLFSWESDSATRTASAGVATFEWDCNPSQARTVPMTATGLSSGRSLSFRFETIRPPVVFTIENPFTCDGTEGAAPIIGQVSGFDSAESVTISWDRSSSSGAAIDGKRSIRWECDDADARTTPLTAVGQVSGQTGTIQFVMVP